MPTRHSAASPVPEALQRLLRAIFTVGDPPIRAVLQRGIDDQTLRGDLTADQLVPLLGGLALAAFAAELPQTAGVGQAAAVITSMFLCGARSQR